MPSVKFARSTGSSKRTAVIVVDFQNEFVRTDGKLNSEVAEMMKLTGMLQKVPHVLRAAR